MIFNVGDGKRYAVHLDGREIKGVVFADDHKGCIDIQVYDKSGRVMINYDEGSVVTARLYGSVKVTEVDHINGRADRYIDYRPCSHQSLCKRCHSRKTRSEQLSKKLVEKN